MKLAFKRAAAGGMWDKAIGWWTRSPYCHVELVFDPADVAEILAQQIVPRKAKLMGSYTPGASLCFSSDSGDGGTRFRWIELDPAIWEVIDAPAPADGNDLLSATLCVDFCGVGYDELAIVGFVLPFGEYDPAHRICSGMCAEICIDRGAPIKPGTHTERYSPGSLYRAIQALKPQGEKTNA